MRDYMREYHAEFRLGLRRSEPPAVVEAKMDERGAKLIVGALILPTAVT